MLDRLTTEQPNPESARIDELSSLDIVRVMNREDAQVAAAVAAEADAIAQAVDKIVAAWKAGGRLIYVGAGTSGRLGVLDASECPPTFNTDPSQVVGVIAGGPPALVRSVELAEDSPQFGARDLDAIEVSAADVVVGIATSGRTPYVLGALDHARNRNARTVGIACNAESPLRAVSDIMITPIVGPEVISGSTRLKAGTATKLVLNTLTTASMIRLGKTYGNLMVDMRATNEKLSQRACRIVRRVTGLDEASARALLERCDGELKTAIVVQKRSCSPSSARAALSVAEGRLRDVIGRGDV